MKCLKLALVLVCALPLVTGKVRALEKVGAKMDQVSSGTLVTLSGRHAPRAQIVVVSGNKVVAAAIDRGSGDFEFSFRVSADQLGDLRVFGVDPAAKTNEVRIPSGGLSQLLLPPTLVPDPDYPEREDSVGVGGYTYPGAVLTLYLGDSQGSVVVYQVQSGRDGDWSYEFGGLAAGEYELVATSQYGSLQSSQSQTMLIIVEMPGGAIEDVGNQVSRVVKRVSDVVLPPGVGDVVRDVAPGAREVSERVAPVVSAGLLAQLTLVARDILYFLTQMVFAGLQYFGFWRKRHPWGVVYDSLTKQPVMLATVRLYQIGQANKLVETDVTSKAGMFSFFPKAGEYMLKVAKTGYQFPSKLVYGREDGEYAHVYHGEKIRFEGEKQAVEVSVPMDPVEARVDWKFRVVSFIRRRIYWLTMTSLIIGWAMSLLSVLGGEGGVDGFFLLFYTAMLLLQIYLYYLRHSSWGVVVNMKGEPVKGVQLDLMDPKFERLVQRRITDEDGRYQFIVPEGLYEIRLSSVAHKLVTERPKYYQGQDIVVTGKRPKVIKLKLMVKVAGTL